MSRDSYDDDRGLENSIDLGIDKGLEIEKDTGTLAFEAANSINEIKNRMSDELTIEDIAYLKEKAQERFNDMANEIDGMEFTPLGVSGERDDENPRDAAMQELADSMGAVLNAEVIGVLKNNGAPEKCIAQDEKGDTFTVPLGSIEVTDVSHF